MDPDQPRPGSTPRRPVAVDSPPATGPSEAMAALVAHAGSRRENFGAAVRAALRLDVAVDDAAVLDTIGRLQAERAVAKEDEDLPLEVGRLRARAEGLEHQLEQLAVDKDVAVHHVELRAQDLERANAQLAREASELEEAVTQARAVLSAAGVGLDDDLSVAAGIRDLIRQRDGATARPDGVPLMAPLFEIAKAHASFVSVVTRANIYARTSGAHLGVVHLEEDGWVARDASGCRRPGVFLEREHAEAVLVAMRSGLAEVTGG